MAKSKSLDDKKVYAIVAKELEHFLQLVKGHERLLYAIGKL